MPTTIVGRICNFVISLIRLIVSRAANPPPAGNPPGGMPPPRRPRPLVGPKPPPVVHLDEDGQQITWRSGVSTRSMRKMQEQMDEDRLAYYFQTYYGFGHL